MKRAGFYAGTWLLLGLLFLLFPAIDLAANRAVLCTRRGISACPLAAAGSGRDRHSLDHQDHRADCRGRRGLAGADGPSAVAARPQGAGVPDRRHRARSRADHQHCPERQLGPGAPLPDRFVRRHAPVHPGAAAGSAVPAQLRFCLGPCRARLFRRELCLPAPGRQAPAARDRNRARVRDAGRDRADRRRGAFSVGRRAMPG